jgi:hypothetical protein
VAFAELEHDGASPIAAATLLLVRRSSPALPAMAIVESFEDPARVTSAVTVATVLLLVRWEPASLA